MLQKWRLIINERYEITSTEPLTVGLNYKYKRKIPYSNGIHGQDTIPYSNVSNRLCMNPWSNRQGIWRIQSGTYTDWYNSLKNIYHKNSLKNIDHVYDCVHVNGCVRYESPMIGNLRTWVSHTNAVWRVIKKEIVPCSF